MKTAKKVLSIIGAIALFGFFSIAEAKQVKKKTNAELFRTTHTIAKKEAAVLFKKQNKKKAKKTAKQSIKLGKEKKDKIKTVKISQPTIFQNRVDSRNDTSAKNPTKKFKFKNKSRVLPPHVTLAAKRLNELRSRTRLARERLSHLTDRLGTSEPDLLDDPRTDPRMEWIKHQVNRQMEMDRFMRHPFHDLIDWGTAGPKPGREPPSSTEAWFEWWGNNQLHNLASTTNSDPRIPGYTSSFGLGKYNHNQAVNNNAVITKYGDVAGAYSNSADQSNTDEGDESEDSGENNSSTDADSEDEADMVFTEEEVGIEPENTDDADPEGDDPDESYAPVNVTAVKASVMIGAEASMGNNSSNDGNPQNGNGKPAIKRSVHEGGEGNGSGLGEIGKAHTTGSPIPEDGQPDEFVSPTVSGAVSHVKVGGYNYQPEPGGGDPDDPRANESMGGIMGTTGNAMAGGYNSQPGPDGEDPDDPRANEDMIKP